ncbi:MAG: hypothetical protein ACE5FL_01105 [Myxococcota bacterium]
MAATAAGDPRAEQFEAALRRDDPFELQELILDVALESDRREWAEWACTVLARHRNATVRGNALLGFGHLARRFGFVDPKRARPLIETGLHSHHEFVRAQAESAADDVDAYLSWGVARPSR